MILVVVGKRGKMEENDDTNFHPGWAACSLLPREVRHSLANGAMEKGASASALSSTSGDEIVGSPFLEVRLHTHLFIFYHFYGTESSPCPGCVIPGKQAKSYQTWLMENIFISKWTVWQV